MNNTKRRIFETAVKLFAEKGYENTGIDEITAVAGYAKGALYYHFETKEGLFDLLLEEGQKLLLNSIEIKFKKCNNSIEKLKAILMVEIKSIINYEDLITVIINNTLGDTPRTKKCKAAVDNFIQSIQKVIEEGIKEGVFYDGDPEAIACGIFGITFSSLLVKLKKNREITANEIYDGFVETIVKGLTK